jgi:argininosuccinate lyase
MDTRGQRLRKQSDAALAFTSSSGPDSRIARHVVAVNMAHMLALLKAGQVGRPTSSRCLRFLLTASSGPRSRQGSEDFHHQLEQDAVDELGVDIAGYLNYGKSRNDQVATAIRMELRERILELARAIALLQGALLTVAEREGTHVVPGYTHLQRAQPVTIGHYCFAYFDSLARDHERLLQAYGRTNLSPMGAAALAGTEVHIDRRSLAGSLGFEAPVGNAMDAVSSRDFAAEAVFCASMAMLDASRLSEELILWSTSEFEFVELDDRYAASSSIMPQKKNPVVAETARAKAGSVVGGLVAVLTILKALPYSYNLDLQEATPPVWRAFDDASAAFRSLAGAVESMKFTKRATESLSADGSTAVSLANYLVRRHGFSFREAHSLVGGLCKAAAEKGVSLSEAVTRGLPEASIRAGRSVSIDRKTIEEILDPSKFAAAIATEGGANPRFVAAEIATRKAELRSGRKAVALLSGLLESSRRRLLKSAERIAREVKSKS